MIRTNLSTRPFYNIRAVQIGIAALALTVVAITAYNVIEIIRLSSSQRTLGAQAQQAEDEAARLRREAVQILQRIDPKELEVVAAEAREANAIIDQRTFSWTDLFTHFEATLPADVRITAVTPSPGDQMVAIGVEARSVEDLDEFIEGLEGTGVFHDVLAVNEVTMENGLIEAIIRATYEQPDRRAEVRP